MKARLPLQLAVVTVVFAGVTVRNLGLPVPWIPEIQGLCPFGAMQNVMGFLLHSGTLYWLPAGVLLATVVLGPVFCGRACAIGSVQEWIGRLGKRVLGKRYNPRVPGDRALRWLRWLVPLLLLASITPDAINISYALFHGWTAVVPVTALVLLAVVLVASFFIERPWCRWLCPWGAVQGTISKISPWTIRRNEQTCISCNKCTRACPFHIAVATQPAVRDSRCNRCEGCIEACPVKGALQWAGPAGRMPLRRGVAITAATIALILLPVLAPLSTATTNATTNTATDAPAGAERGELAITPMMTLTELAAAAAMDPQELLLILGLPAEFDLELMLIDVEDEPGFQEVTVGYIRQVME